MFSRALRGYKQVFSLNYTKSKTTRNKLCALDIMLRNKALIEIGERLEDMPMGLAHGINKLPLNLKRQKLL
jgi:hypothetical protein